MDVDLKKIAEELTRQVGKRSLIPAGYTYLGQMISHDIVPSTSAVDGPRRFRVAAKLNLDSLYDAGNPSCGFPVPQEASDWDLPRVEGKAQIPEPRNDENVIIAQLHRLWMRLHERIESEGASFGEARRDVIQLFQAVVIDDYLQRILQPHIFQAYFRRGEKHLGFAEDEVPKVFSLAAFRFGHSMVRQSYDLNGSGGLGVGLSDLRKTGSAIPAAYRIDWWRFFPVDSRPPQRAMRIDTSITAFMKDVIIRNLERGRKLITGLSYVRGLLEGRNLGDERFPRLDPTLHLYPATNDSALVLCHKGGDLPLFPYLLMEAELQGNGMRLGVLGSLIVAEVIQNAIRCASPSVFQNGVYRFELVWKDLSLACRELLVASRDGNISAPESLDMRTILKMTELPQINTKTRSNFMADSLESWLPADSTQATRVFEPVTIDAHAENDLRNWHPTATEDLPCNFRLVRVGNTAVATVAIVDPVDNWDEKFRAVLESLQLRVVNEGQPDEHLADPNVAQSPETVMDGWKVVSWTIKRTGFDGHQDPMKPTTLTDRIVWERADGSGETAVSSYIWRPYQ